MEDMIAVQTYSSRIEAEIGRGKLEANGIKSIVQADDGGGQEGFLLNATGFVKLLVLKKQYDAARKIIHS